MRTLSIEEPLLTSVVSDPMLVSICNDDARRARVYQSLFHALGMPRKWACVDCIDVYNMVHRLILEQHVNTNHTIQQPSIERPNTPGIWRGATRTRWVKPVGITRSNTPCFWPVFPGYRPRESLRPGLPGDVGNIPPSTVQHPGPCRT